MSTDSVRRNPKDFLTQFLCSLVSDILTPQWVASDREYFRPLRAEPRAAQTTATLGTASSVPFLEKQPTMGMWDIDLGTELPLWGGEHSCTCGGAKASTGDQHPALGNWGFGLWFPIDFHMMESLNDPTAPILNTDYRFNLMLKGDFTYRQAHGNSDYASLRIRAGHESTHLGDEYTLRSMRSNPSIFERINVSYEYVDMAIGFSGVRAAARYATHFGIIHTAKPWTRSYYDIDETPDLTISPIGPVTPSTRTVEPYVGGEIERVTLDWFTGKPYLGWLKDWAGYLSLDARNRTIYNYHKRSPAMDDETQWSTNFVAGVYPRADRNVAIQFRVYYGVNPHGQFRSQRNFHLLGFGLHLNP